MRALPCPKCTWGNRRRCPSPPQPGLKNREEDGVSADIDVSGAITGGAARWRREAQEWASHYPPHEIRLIGLGERVEPRWLVRREVVANREYRIAANNVSFLTGTKRVVLLRNPLHFLWPGEEQRLPVLPVRLRRQVPVIRTLARRADVVVVPCTAMAERVLHAVPSLTERVQVRHHPLRPRAVAHRHDGAPFVLYPSLPAPHKDLEGGLQRLVDALDRSGSDLRVKVTASSGDIGRVAGHIRVDAIGTQSLEQMDELWSTASAVYVPYSVESFGYPVAEGRAAGVPVVAVDNPQNREIGGQALFGFVEDRPDSLVDALALARGAKIEPDPDPFDPDAYFAWLTTR